MCTHCSLQSIQWQCWTQVLFQNHSWLVFWSHKAHMFQWGVQHVWTGTWSRCSSPPQNLFVSTTHCSAGLDHFFPNHSVAVERKQQTKKVLTKKLHTKTVKIEKLLIEKQSPSLLFLQEFRGLVSARSCWSNAIIEHQWDHLCKSKSWSVCCFGA